MILKPKQKPRNSSKSSLPPYSLPILNSKARWCPIPPPSSRSRNRFSVTVYCGIRNGPRAADKKVTRLYFHWNPRRSPFSPPLSLCFSSFVVSRARREIQFYSSRWHVYRSQRATLFKILITRPEARVRERGRYWSDGCAYMLKSFLRNESCAKYARRREREGNRIFLRCRVEASGAGPFFLTYT